MAGFKKRSDGGFNNGGFNNGGRLLGPDSGGSDTGSRLTGRDSGSPDTGGRLLGPNNGGSDTGSRLTGRDSGNIFNAKQGILKSTNESAASSDPELGKNEYRGVIANCAVITDNRGGFSKWMHSVFSGVDFSTSDTINVFTLIPEETLRSIGQDIGCHYEVLLYGDILDSHLNADEGVIVKGKRNRRNQIEARKIVKIYSNVEIRIKNGISGFAVRLITALAVLIPLYLILYWLC